MSENDEADAGLTQAFPILSWDAQVRCSLGIAYINTLPPPVTGDHRPTLPRREKLGIAEVEDLPDQKSVVVTRLHKARRIVAMAEHGVNDATALVAADVGVAMGTGTNDAMESAGVTLLKGYLGGIVRASRLSQATLRNIRQNLFFAFIYNAAGIQSRRLRSTRHSACCCRRSSPQPRWRCHR